MLVRFCCPRCESQNRANLVDGADTRLRCTQCEWSGRDLTHIPGGRPDKCLVCGCSDLWRQKDFPQRLGVAMVVAGVIGSTWFIFHYQPVWAMGVLLFFALLDMLLYAWMPDVLVCYRCNARYRDPQPGAAYPAFQLETSERYRQESRRLAEARDGGVSQS
ncbi:MAG: hypothetical protein ACK5TO_12040 [Planctomycetaceae bacterium]